MGDLSILKEGHDGRSSEASQPTNPPPSLTPLFVHVLRLRDEEAERPDWTLTLTPTPPQPPSSLPHPMSSSSSASMDSEVLINLEHRSEDADRLSIMASTSASTLPTSFATPPLEDIPIAPFSHAPKRKPEGLQQPACPGKKPALGSNAPNPELLWEEAERDEDSLESMDPESSDWLSSFHSFSGSERIRALSCLVQRCSLAEIRHLQKVIEPHLQKDFIAALPKELSLMVLGCLGPKDLARAAGVSRYWRTLTEDHLLWRERCQETGLSFDQFPNSQQPGPCHGRSKWKALFLRHSRVNANWRKGLADEAATGKLLRGHDDHVITCLQIAGEKILSGSDDNTLKLWCARTGAQLVTLVGHTGGVWSSQMTKDGSIVVSGSTDRTVRVWEASSGQCLHTLSGHTSTVRCMALEGKVVVSGSRDTTLRVWDISEGRHLHTLTGHVAAVRCVQLHNHRVVSGAYDYTVKVWDLRSQTCTHTLAGHTNRVYSLQLCPQRDLVISGSLDTSIRVWDLRTGNCLHTLMGHQSLTSGMELRGRTLVSGNADSTVKVWDIVDGQCLHTLSGPNRHTSAVTSLQFLANGLVVTSSDDGTVKLWDAASGTFVRDVVELPSRDSGGCIWRLKATPSALVCAAGSRTGTEDTKLILLDFDAPFP